MCLRISCQLPSSRLLANNRDRSVRLISPIPLNALPVQRTRTGRSACATRFLVAMLLGMTAKANECEKPQGPANFFCCGAPSRRSRAPWATKDRPFDAPFETQGKHGGTATPERKPTNCRSLGPPTRTRDFLSARATVRARETRVGDVSGLVMTASSARPKKPHPQNRRVRHPARMAAS